MTPTDPVFIRWGTGGTKLQGKASNYDNKVVQRDKKPIYSLLSTPVRFINPLKTNRNMCMKRKYMYMYILTNCFKSTYTCSDN